MEVLDFHGGFTGAGFGDVEDGLYDPAIKGGLFNLAFRRQRDAEGNPIGPGFRWQNE